MKPILVLALDRRIGPVSFAETRPQVTKALGRGVVARLDGHRLRFYLTLRATGGLLT